MHDFPPEQLQFKTGCTCDDCREARSKYNRERYLARQEEIKARRRERGNPPSAFAAWYYERGGQEKTAARRRAQRLQARPTEGD